jgi:endonuclease/exonuclease/phosphatase (EEP) superfamily protein YafD
MRNEQLITFVQDFRSHEADRKHDNILAIGDFNITPWSSYYSILSNAFSGELVNITKRIPFLFTRKLKLFPLFQAHIDHLRTSSSLTVQNFQTIILP